MPVDWNSSIGYDLMQAGIKNPGIMHEGMLSTFWILCVMYKIHFFLQFDVNIYCRCALVLFMAIVQDKDVGE